MLHTYKHKQGDKTLFNVQQVSKQTNLPEGLCCLGCIAMIPLHTLRGLSPVPTEATHRMSCAACGGLCPGARKRPCAAVTANAIVQTAGKFLQWILSKEKDRIYFSVNVDSPRFYGSDVLSDSLLMEQ